MIINEGRRKRVFSTEKELSSYLKGKNYQVSNTSVRDDGKIEIEYSDDWDYEKDSDELSDAERASTYKRTTKTDNHDELKSFSINKLKDLGYTGKLFTVLRGKDTVGKRFYKNKEDAKASITATNSGELYQVEVNNGKIGDNYKKL